MTAEDAMIIERGDKKLQLGLNEHFLELSFLSGMYAVLTLNLIVNCVTLISSLLLITGAIKVRPELCTIDLDYESGLINN